MTGTATFSHNVPAEPVITSPALAKDEETAAETLISTADLVITWEGVTQTVDGGPLTISG